MLFIKYFNYVLNYFHFPLFYWDSEKIFFFYTQRIDIKKPLDEWFSLNLYFSHSSKLDIYLQSLQAHLHLILKYNGIK